MKKAIIKLTVISTAILPAVAFAENLIDLSKRLLNGIGDIVKIATPVVFGMAILAFFWGVSRYVFSQSTEKKQEAKGVLLWALIAVFLMASIYGIVALLQATLNVGGNGSFDVPTVGGSSNNGSTSDYPRYYHTGTD